MILNVISIKNSLSFLSFNKISLSFTPTIINFSSLSFSLLLLPSITVYLISVFKISNSYISLNNFFKHSSKGIPLNFPNIVVLISEISLLFKSNLEQVNFENSFFISIFSNLSFSLNRYSTNKA